MTITLDRADILDICAGMLQRAGISAAELAKHMKPPAPAAAPKPVKDAAPLPLSPRWAQALDHADCADGTTCAELMSLMHIGLQTAFIYLDDLRERGLVTRVKAPGIRAARFFAQPHHAQAWVDSHTKAKKAPPARVALSEKELMTLRTNAAKKAAAHKAQPMTRKVTDKHQGPADVVRYTAGDSKAAKPLQKGAPVDYSRARHTVAATPAEVAAHQRLRLEPDPRWPSFSSAPLGVNPDTGLAWGASA
jgi:hypothetical protein